MILILNRAPEVEKKKGSLMNKLSLSAMLLCLAISVVGYS
jgi:hypothetical protein